MPKSRSIANYPSEYFDIAQRVAAGQTVRLPVTSRAQAHAVRLDYYGFRRALKDATEWDLNGTAAQDNTIRRMIEMVRIQITNTEVTFLHPDQSPFASLAREALAKLPAAAPPIAVPQGTPTPTSTQNAQVRNIPLILPQSDSSEDVLARHMGRCDECDVSFPCWQMGVRCIRDERLG